MEDVRHVRVQASAAEAAAATRFQRRHSPACHELMYVSNGDLNGVCHFLGRACGTQQWVNPVLAGTIQVWHPPWLLTNAATHALSTGCWLRSMLVTSANCLQPCQCRARPIQSYTCLFFSPALLAWSTPSILAQVRASSPACRTTDPRGLVDGRFLRANWAGPRLEGGVPSTWWLLDLGPAYALVCNYYTLRHDASANFLRSWAFQVRHEPSIELWGFYPHPLTQGVHVALQQGPSPCPSAGHQRAHLRRGCCGVCMLHRWELQRQWCNACCASAGVS